LGRPGGCAERSPHTGLTLYQVLDLPQDLLKTKPPQTAQNLTKHYC